MTRRAGTTLVEVLVAIFIMAIGLMTLLTLFPLGALSMAQAIKDTRTGHAAANAQAIAEAMKIRQDALVQQALNTPLTGLPPVTSDGSGYSVYVDALGYLTSPSAVGGTIQRVTPNFVANPNPGYSSIRVAYRWFSLLDDMNFQKDGPQAGLPVGGPSNIEREGRYSWAYLVKRPRNADQSLVDLTVVLYSGRAPQSLGEQAVGTVSGLTAGSTFVDLTGRPDVRKGSWILDATMKNGAAPDPHGHFYRVVGVSDVGPNRRLELETPLRQSATVANSVVVLMDTVVEVFEKGTGWQP